MKYFSCVPGVCDTKGHFIETRRSKFLDRYYMPRCLCNCLPLVMKFYLLNTVHVYWACVTLHAT